MTQIDYESQEAKIRAFEKGHRAVHVMNIGMQFGIFKALHRSSGGHTAADLAGELMLHEPYLKIWLQTAFHLDLLDWDRNGGFSLQPYMAEILGIDLAAEPVVVNSGSSPLIRYIRTGVPAPFNRSPEESLATSSATKSVYMVFLSYLLKKHNTMKQLMEKGIRFIDIGCGSGNLVIELALAFPRSFFKGIDTDIYGIERAESSALTLGLAERVSFEDMAAEELTCHAEFDVACMVATLHEILPSERAHALEKVYQAVKPGGCMLILDFPYPEKLEEFRHPRYSIGIVEQYFEAPNGIIHLGAAEQNTLLEQAGFKEIQRSDINNGMFDFIMAVK
ncbi:class I SAM-dependent methyltransferase [Thermodesulfobacteriota bacterium]